jgi:hypothetical protein
LAAKYPYISGTSALTQALDFLRKSFPTTFNGETLKKLSIGPGNESYIVNIIRFLGFITEEDARTDKAQNLFSLHDDSEFQKSFSQIIEEAYADLFALHHDGTWQLSPQKLIAYFRQTDKTSEIVGTRQANTFKSLAAYAGHPDATAQQKVRPTSQAKSATKVAKAPGRGKTAPPQTNVIQTPPATPPHRDFGLTVRIEINLPSAGDQATYDKIFKSIKENFLNA